MMSKNSEQKIASVDIKNRLTQLWNCNPEGLQLVSDVVSKYTSKDNDLRGPKKSPLEPDDEANLMEYEILKAGVVMDDLVKVRKTMRWLSYLSEDDKYKGAANKLIGILFDLTFQLNPVRNPEEKESVAKMQMFLKENNMDKKEILNAWGKHLKSIKNLSKSATNLQMFFTGTPILGDDVGIFLRNLKLILTEAKKEKNVPHVFGELKRNFPLMLNDYYAYVKNADHQVYINKLLDQLNLIILAENDPDIKASLQFVENALFLRNAELNKVASEEKIDVPKPMKKFKEARAGLDNKVALSGYMKLLKKSESETKDTLMNEAISSVREFEKDFKDPEKKKVILSYLSQLNDKELFNTIQSMLETILKDNKREGTLLRTNSQFMGELIKLYVNRYPQSERIEKLEDLSHFVFLSAMSDAGLKIPVGQTKEDYCAKAAATAIIFNVYGVAPKKDGVYEDKKYELIREKISLAAKSEPNKNSVVMQNNEVKNMPQSKLSSEKITDKRIRVIVSNCVDMMKEILGSNDQDSHSFGALLSAIVRELNIIPLGSVNNLQDSISFIIVKQFSDHPDLFPNKMIDSKLFQDMLARMNINISSAVLKMQIGAIQSAGINELKRDTDSKAAEREKSQFSFFLPIKNISIIQDALKEFKTNEAMTFFSSLSVLMTGSKEVNLVNDKEDLMKNAMAATKKVYPEFGFSKLIEADKDGKLALDILRKLTNQTEDQIKLLCLSISDKETVEQKLSNK